MKNSANDEYECDYAEKFEGNTIEALSDSKKSAPLMA
jgi:hypothetical protein